MSRYISLVFRKHIFYHYCDEVIKGLVISGFNCIMSMALSGMNFFSVTMKTTVSYSKRWRAVIPNNRVFMNSITANDGSEKERRAPKNASWFH